MSLAAFAASPVATVTSREPFEVRGVSVPVNGVSNWPVAVGDAIGTLASPAEIRFRDGNRVTLAAGSRALLERSGATVVLRLQRGAASYNLASPSTLRLFEGSRAVSTASGSTGIFGEPAARGRIAPASLPAPPAPVSGSQPAGTAPATPTSGGMAPAPPPPPKK